MSSSRSRPPVGLRILFGLAIAAVFLALVEGLLAVVGVAPVLYEEDPYVGFSSRIPLFEASERDDGSAWLSTAANKLRVFNPQSFPRQKAEGTVRVFCMGGSTTYGRPYTDGTSFAGWLRHLLPAVDQTRSWEVINAGGISYASYRVSALMEELVEYDPDVFVIYTGHNEFLERRTYGRLMDTPAVVRAVGAVASGTRIYAALHAALGRDGAALSERVELDAEVNTRLGDSVGPTDYRRDDEQQARVVEHYRLNLQRSVRIARSAGATPILVVPASNLGACTPFKSEPSASVPLDRIAAHDERLVRARAALESGDPHAALSQAEAVLAEDDRRADAHYWRGLALRSLGQDEAALTALKRARDEDVCPLRMLGSMGDVVREVARDMDVPLVDFESLVAAQSAGGIADEELFLDHVHPTIYGYRLLAVHLVESFRGSGLLTGASPLTDDAIEAVTLQVESTLDRRAHGEALRNLSKVLRWAGKIQDADRLAIQASEMVPDDPEAFYSRGQTAMAQGRVDEAIQMFQRAIELQPGLVAGHLELGMALNAVGRYPEALTSTRRALQLAPENPQSQNNLGIVLFSMGRHEDAVRAYQSCIDQHPRYLKAYNNLGQTYLVMRRYDEAIDALEHALELDPDYVVSRYNLALAHANLGQRQLARGYFGRILEQEPRHAPSIYGLGALAAQEGRIADAIGYCEMALSIDPDHADSQKLLPRLRKMAGTER